MKALSQVIDPHYVQCSRQDAAQILGRSASEFDRLRKSDPRAPEAIKTSDDRMAKVVFRLSEVYAYSEALMDDGRKRFKEQQRLKASQGTTTMPVKNPGEDE